MADKMEKDWAFSMSEFTREELKNTMGAGYSCLAGSPQEDCWKDLLLNTDIATGLLVGYTSGLEFSETVTLAFNPSLIFTMAVVVTVVKQLTTALQCAATALGAPGIALYTGEGIPPCIFIPADELHH